MVPAFKMGYRAMWIAAFVAIVSTVPIASAQSPEIGDVQKLKAISFSMHVGSTDKDAKRVTYTPPPGWYVRSHSVESANKHGNVSFAISTVPGNWRWSSDERNDETNKQQFGATAQVPKVGGGQAKVQQHRTFKLNDQQTVQATHHALVLDVTAKGEGFLKGGSGIELTVVAELVYLGVEETPNAKLLPPTAP